MNLLECRPLSGAVKNENRTRINRIATDKKFILTSSPPCKYVSHFTLLLTLFAWGLPAIVLADLGDIVRNLHPYLAFQEEYNDNINLTAENKKEDFITTVYPGLKYASPETDMRYGLNLDYLLGLVFYAKDAENNYVSHAGTLNAWYTIDRRLTFRVREYVLRSEEPRERDFSASPLVDQYLLGTQRERSIYLRNVFEPSVEYKFGPENLMGFNYRNNTYDNENPRLESSQENYLNPIFSYWFNVKSGMSLEYGLTLANFQQQPDFTGHMARGRYTYRLNTRTSVFGEFTYMKRNFEPSSPDYDVSKPTVGMSHSFSPTVSANVQLGYFRQNQAQGEATSGFSYDSSITQRGLSTTYTLSLQGGYKEDFFTAENLGFTRHNTVLGKVTHQLLQRMALSLAGSYEKAQYALNRKDDIWSVNGNWTYQVLKWLSLSLDFIHRENSSNVDINDYRENRGVFKFVATY